MTTDHCESLMIKRENWIPGNFIYENPHDYDSICQDSIFLNIDSNKYADPYGTNNPQKSICEPERRWCEIYEDGAESLYSHHYTSSPSSVNSQTCNDYQFQYHYSDNSKKIDSDASNFSEQHHNRNDYSWTRETAGYTESFFNKSQPMQGRRTETESFSPPIKKRNTANRKERRRTQSINSAFTNLRECIPSVPADTKLSKIKTLRLATTYITHLLESLNSDDPSSCEKFKADLSNHGAKKSNIISYYKLSQTQHKVDKANTDSTYTKYQNQDETIKKTKGRTGWPQHVWAMELKQEQL